MDALTEKLGIKLQEWKREISDSAQQTLRERVRQYISEIIDLADRDILDLLPSRTVEQDVLDLTDLRIIQPNSVVQWENTRKGKRFLPIHIRTIQLF
jgi:hypothetical protein